MGFSLHGHLHMVTWASPQHDDLYYKRQKVEVTHLIRPRSGNHIAPLLLYSFGSQSQREEM